MTNLEEEINKRLKIFPTTRYQGSKRRILPWLYKIFKDLEFESVLDGFGGSASVSYLFKLMGKRIIFNDILKSNFQTGLALIENNTIRLEQSDLDFLQRHNGYVYPTFIRDTFENIYYYDHENEWLDMVSFNIHKLSEKYEGRTLKKKRALAYHALFQACLSKRPFNLFHRKNVYLRKADVERKFNNKKAWDTEFPVLFSRFTKETSEKVFSNKKRNRALCCDLLKVRTGKYDLIYLDPPYQRPQDSQPKDYYSLYHFLEGLVDYNNWPSRIDLSKKHKPLVKNHSKYENNSLLEKLEIIVKRFNSSMIAISYGKPGKPPIGEIRGLLKAYKNKVLVFSTDYAYKLNKGNCNNMREILIIGT